MRARWTCRLLISVEMMFRTDCMSLRRRSTHADGVGRKVVEWCLGHRDVELVGPAEAFDVDPFVFVWALIESVGGSGRQYM